MKKLAFLGIMILVFSLLTVSVVLATAGVGNPTGEVTHIDDVGKTLTLVNDDGTILVTLPDDFDYSTVAVGMIVTAKGEWVDDENFTAVWVKDSVDADLEEPDPDDGAGESAGDGNAWGEAGVYCAEGSEKAHPVAAKIAEKYGVEEGFVMKYVCSGMGFGSVMLAIQMGGEGADAMLEQVQAGKGWGQIWKEAGLIGNEKGDSPPPGILKKGEKPGNGPPDGKGPNK